MKIKKLAGTGGFPAGLSPLAGAIAVDDAGSVAGECFSGGAPARVLVVVTRQIGDVLLTTPLIRDARRLWPSAAIDVLGFAGTLGMLAGNADIRRTIEAPSRASNESTLAFARRIWRKYDLAVVTEHSDRAHLYGFFAAAVRVGVVPQEFRHAWWKRMLLHHAVRRDGDAGSIHVIDEKLRLLAPWRGARSRRAALVTPSATPVGGPLRERLRDGYVVVHVPSMWNYKQWPLAHYRELIGAFIAIGRQVVLTGGASPADRAKIAQVMAGSTAADVIDAGGELELGQVTSLLAGASLYVGPDGSVTHLAAAVGVPMIAIFGPTNPLRWGPVGSAATREAPWERHAAAAQTRGPIVLMQGAGNCVPCGRAGCDDHRDSASRCLQEIAPARVIARALDLLRSGAGRLPG